MNRKWISHILLFAFYSEYSKLYRTGDYATILSDGIVQYDGRMDSQIKLRGHRVDLSEIEKHLTSLEDVEKGYVLCYHAGQTDQEILAFVHLVPDSSIQNSIQIESILRERLVNYMVPQVILMEKVPLLVNGKIDRQSLFKLFENMNRHGE